MNNDLAGPPQRSFSLRVFGVGDTGINVVDLLIADGLAPVSCVAVNIEGPTVESSRAQQKLRLENKRLRGLGSGGDPERGRQAAEEKSDELKAVCEGTEVVFVVAGLGGGSGTGISPVVARAAKAAGALVLAFVTLPFECEGSRRQSLAQEGLEELRAVTDGVICLPNQKIFKLIEENTTVLETFKIVNRLLADGVYGLWRLMGFKGLIEIPLEDIYHVLEGRHAESAFAVAEASGASRSVRVTEKLFAHPLLEGGQVLSESEVILVSLTAGASLTMAEVNYVTQEIKGKCEAAQVVVGACIEENFGERLAVTIITSGKPQRQAPLRDSLEDLDTQLLDRGSAAKPNSRFLPPPPVLAPGQAQQLLSRQNRARLGPRKPSAKMRQTQLPLEIVSKGRFDKSEPTIHKGEDLDVPTYIRRGVPLN
jgi:cell division protein FtsZ